MKKKKQGLHKRVLLFLSVKPNIIYIVFSTIRSSVYRREVTMKHIATVFSAIILFISFSGTTQGFTALSDPGPYFARGMNITVPLRGDLIWGPSFGFYFGRDQVGMMRYTGKIYYPAIDTPLENDQYSIYYPPDTSGAPYPVVVFFQGANVGIEQYAWLFEHLAGHGFIVLAVTEVMASMNYLEGQFLNLYPMAVLEGAETWLTHMMIPDVVTYLENINVSTHDPLPLLAQTGSPPLEEDTIDCVRNNIVQYLCSDETTPCTDDSDCNGIGNGSCSTYPSETSIFEGMIDTDKITLGGHSMGGFLTLMCANDNITNPPRPEGGSFTKGIVAAFVYGAHTFRSSGSGFDAPVNVPLLMLGGEKDGVAAGQTPDDADASGWERIKYTFNNYIDSSADNSRYLIGIRGANHLSIGTRPDPYFDRSFLDRKDGIMSSYMAHRIMKEKITAFVEYYAKGNPDPNILSVLTGSPAEPYILTDDPDDFQIK